MNEPSISIVTPTLNAAKYLSGCLDSVCSQAYPNVEHFVVDGGSGDATIALAEAAAGVSIVVLRGSNQAQAINMGFRRSSGEILAWLNADDRYAPGALELIARQFAADGTVDVVFGDCLVVDHRGRPLWSEQPGAYDFQRLLRHGNYLPQPAVFLRRRVLERVGFLDESFEYGMDYEFWLRLRGCRVQYLPRVLATFCWHPTSKTARSQIGNWREGLRAARRHGGGWTLPLAWSFSRMLLTVARQRLEYAVSARA
jgi:glycosyltransferase involved in cell wall biosynthesis